MRGLFVSDLHLFSQRSVGQRHWHRMSDSIARAEYVVLGGDIFDFRWSRLGTFSESLVGAQRWLEQAFELNPNAQWVYILGNHDCHPRFQGVLDRLSARHDRFHWHPTHWKVGRSVFVHGDLLDCGDTLDKFHQYRRRFHEATPKGHVPNALYRLVVETRLHGILPAWRHWASATCTKLLQRLPMLGETILDRVDRVVFGHTHVPLDCWRVNGVEFSNPGAGIRHLAFRPIHVGPELQAIGGRQIAWCG